MTVKEITESDRMDTSEAALLERKLILAAAVGAMASGFFPWAQPFGLGVWGFDDGDGLITMSTAVIVFLLVWLEWRKITASVAVALGGFLIFVAIINLTSGPGPGIILATVTNLLMVAAGVSAFWKFGQIK